MVDFTKYLFYNLWKVYNFFMKKEIFWIHPWPQKELLKPFEE